LKFFYSSTAIIQLGLSGKWPDDLCAVQRIKAAFYIEIADSLSKQFDLTVQPYPDYVHIFKVSFYEKYRRYIAKSSLLNERNIVFIVRLPQL
jgi:hypothetical protein